jgi:hypothetical protein
MKHIIACTFAALFALILTVSVKAQTTQAIWLTADTKAYKTGETVLVILNASSGTLIQGFTFQIRYDPSCLQPVNASSPIPGMNGLSLPQISGLVDGSYASITPQAVNGVLAEVRFTALKGCQTDLALEDAMLAVRNTEGFAVSLPGTVIGERNLSLFIDNAVGAVNDSQPDESGSILPLEPPKTDQRFPLWMAWVVLSIFVTVAVLFGIYKLFRTRKAYKKTTNRQSIGKQKPTLHIKHGPHAGKSFALNKFPVLLGHDPQNDICINDPHVVGRHAQIYSERNGYYLRDLGGVTFINGRSMNNNTTSLHPGDVVRLGRSFLFVFG